MKKREEEEEAARQREEEAKAARQREAEEKANKKQKQSEKKEQREDPNYFIKLPNGTTAAAGLNQKAKLAFVNDAKKASSDDNGSVKTEEYDETMSPGSANGLTPLFKQRSNQHWISEIITRRLHTR